MLQVFRKTKFKKDLDLAKKRGKNIEKIKAIMEDLIMQVPLSKKFSDHPLVGEFSQYRECHIEPDWLLIYKVQDDSIIFVRTGSHSDLFKK